jgi:hypothetical protein
VRLDDKAYAELVDVRVREPSRIVAALAGRRRRPTLAPDGVLFIVAADHTARGMLGGALRGRSVCGLVAGRALLYPSDGDVAGAIETAGVLVQRAADGKR